MGPSLSRRPPNPEQEYPSMVTVPRHARVSTRILWVPVGSCRKRRKRPRVASNREALLLGERFERGFGPGAEMPNYLGRRQRAEARRIAMVGPAREPDQKARGEEVAR